MMLLLGFIVGGVFGVVVMAVFRGAVMVNLEASRERWKDAAIRSGAFELVNECLHQDALQGVE